MRSLGFRASHLDTLKFFQPQKVILVIFILLPLLSVSRYGWKEETDKDQEGEKGARLY